MDRYFLFRRLRPSGLLLSTLLVLCLSAEASPRQLIWNFQADAQGQPERIWTQVSPSVWAEVYHQGDIRHFFLVINSSANVAGNTGQIAESDNKDIDVFIPDPNASGDHPNWLRQTIPGGSNWGYLGQFTSQAVHAEFYQKGQQNEKLKPNKELVLNIGKLLPSDFFGHAKTAPSSCNEERAEKPIPVNCTDAHGHHFQRLGRCYSCWDPVKNIKCGGPYCQSSTVVCDPSGVIPPPTPNGCS